MLTLRLPTEIEQRLTRLAKKTGRTKSYYARQAILEHLDMLEDVYLAEQRLIDIKSGKSKTLSLDELEQSLGLES